MKTIRYRITLKEPTILTALEGEPNSAVSYDFIPGSVMRGFFISRFAGGQALDLRDTEVTRLFFSAETRYLNAHPVVRDQRSLPVPGTWRCPKYSVEGDAEAGKVLDELYRVEDDRAQDGKKLKKYKNLSGFAVVEGDTAYIYRSERIINVHTQRARRAAEEQQVYRYDALAPGQTFEGMILCQHDADADTLLDLMSHHRSIHIGGARSAGYGLAVIDGEDISDDWLEVEHDLKSEMVITLTSDLILLDQYGQASATLEALQRAFAAYGITFAFGDYQTVKTTMIGGFNRKWGLPLPQTPALQRGSVLTVTSVQGNEAQFEAVLQYGLGERTNEGFGQVALNWQKSKSLEYVKVSFKEALPEEKPKLEGDAAGLWDRLRRSVAEKRVDERFVGYIFADTSGQYQVRGDISPSQLARLRNVIADELRKPTPSLDAISVFLADINGEILAQKNGGRAKQKDAGKQFERARIGRQNLTEWLKAPTFDFGDPKLTSDPIYLLRLVDAVLERAQKDRTRKKERN